jgi:hypothetical protein
VVEVNEDEHDTSERGLPGPGHAHHADRLSCRDRRGDSVQGAAPHTEMHRAAGDLRDGRCRAGRLSGHGPSPPSGRPVAQDQHLVAFRWINLTALTDAITAQYLYKVNRNTRNLRRILGEDHGCLWVPDAGRPKARGRPSSQRVSRRSGPSGRGQAGMKSAMLTGATWGKAGGGEQPSAACGAPGSARQAPGSGHVEELARARRPGGSARAGKSARCLIRPREGDVARSIRTAGIPGGQR